MNSIRTTFPAIVLLCCSIVFISCKGQKKTNIPQGNIETVVAVAQLEETIWIIHQDEKSNYWLGSRENGVFYYDGQHLKNYTIKDGLPSNDVRGIQEDTEGNIFLDTDRGISKFDGHSFKTLPIKNPDAPSEDWVLNPDDLWFRLGFSNNGVYRYDGEYLHFLKFPKSPREDMYYSIHPNTSIQPYGLYTIFKDSKGVMWFGTASLGVCRYDGEKLSWHYEEQLQTTAEGGDFGTRTIFEDKDGLFWINNSRYRYTLLPGSSRFINFKKENGIGYMNERMEQAFPFFLSITQDNEGNFWMVTYDDGVWKYNGKKLLHYPVKSGDTNLLLTTIFKNSKGDLLLGTFKAGVYKFNGASFEKRF